MEGGIRLVSSPLTPKGCTDKSIIRRGGTSGELDLAWLAIHWGLCYEGFYQSRERKKEKAKKRKEAKKCRSSYQKRRPIYQKYH